MMYFLSWTKNNKNYTICGSSDSIEEIYFLLIGNNLITNLKLQDEEENEFFFYDGKFIVKE